MELYSKTLSSITSDIKEKKVTIKEVLDSVYKRIEEVEPKVGAYITLTKTQAYERAEELQKRLDNGEDIGILGGVPIAIKDNICTENVKTTCASRMLENFVPIYNATVIEKLKEAGAIMLGKTNMDEFANQLSKVDVEGVKPTAHILDIKNVFREDNVEKSYDRELILKNAPEKEAGCVSVPQTVE